MTDSIRTHRCRLLSGLAILSSLAAVCGCAPLTGGQQWNSGGPNAFMSTFGLTPAESTPTAPLSKQFPPPSPSSVTGPIEQSAVQQVSGSSGPSNPPYVARQVPMPSPGSYTGVGGNSGYPVNQQPVPSPSSVYGVAPPPTQQFAPPGNYSAPAVAPPGQPGTPYGSANQYPPIVPQATVSPPPPVTTYQGGAAVQSVAPPLPDGILPPGYQGGIVSNPPLYTPTVREADLIINGFPARTGRVMLGGAVNSDAGITGQVTIDERNFDITRWPRSFQDLVSGTAFRGAGQTFRVEAAPGSDFQRYTASFATPNLFRYLPLSFSTSGFLFDRRFNDWDEQRLGGRLALGYRITPDLSLSVGVSGQNVTIYNPRVLGVPQLDAVVGDNDLYAGNISLKHDNRDSPIQASQGHYFDFTFEQVFGEFEYSRFELEYRKYWLLAERADGSGRQTISYSTQVGFSGEDTPIFENFFAGGYATLRGFDFRGASPVESGVEVGGRFQWLNSVEYMFPITADDAFRGVAFVDFGTVEQDVEIQSDTYRVSPGLGLRVAIPMLGPAPLAFDFGFPVAKAPTDDERLFSFYMSLIR